MEVLLSILSFLSSQNSEKFFRDKEGGEPSAWHLLFPRMAEHPGLSPLLLVNTCLLTCLFTLALGQGSFTGNSWVGFERVWEPPEVVYNTKYVFFFPGKAIVVLTGSKTLRTNIGATTS